MKLVRQGEDIAGKFKGAVVTIGNFDGVHRGHRELITEAAKIAKKFSGSLVVMTFDPHPLQVLAPQKGVKRIFSVEDQIEQMQKLGVDVLVVESFNRALAEMTPEEFIDEKIKKIFSPKALVVGYDFNFGKNRQGTPEYLKEKSKLFNFEVIIVPAFKVGGTIVSSTEVRKRIESGDIVSANDFLGRSFYLQGNVIHGDGRGRGLGIPTANLQYESEIFPKTGVYVSRTHIGGKKVFSVTNVGNNPTFTEAISPKPKVETLILDFAEDIYDQHLRVEFLAYLRGEKKFAGVDELKAQIQKDILLAKEWFKKYGN